MITWGANDRASRNCRMLRGKLHSFTPAAGCAVGLVFRAVIMVPRAYSLRLEPGDDLARDGLDLLRLVSVGNEDDLLRSDRQVRLELLDAIIDRSHDGAILGRLAPSGEIPFLAEPFHHPILDGLAGLADEDRQLRGVEELVRILSAFLCKAADLVPRLGEAFGPVEIGQPAIAADGRALEHAIDVSADQDRRIWFLYRLGIHHAGGDVVARELAADRVLGPEAFEDIEVLVHDLAALLERHADGIEFAPVPARCHSHQQPAVGQQDRKSTRLNSSHVRISYAVFC